MKSPTFTPTPHTPGLGPLRLPIHPSWAHSDSPYTRVGPTPTPHTPGLGPLRLPILLGWAHSDSPYSWVGPTQTPHTPGLGPLRLPIHPGWAHSDSPYTQVGPTQDSPYSQVGPTQTPHTPRLGPLRLPILPGWTHSDSPHTRVWPTQTPHYTRFGPTEVFLHKPSSSLAQPASSVVTARYDLCDWSAIYHSPCAVSGLYLQALEMIHNIREAFKAILLESDWMDAETKAVAKEKVLCVGV